MPKGDPQRGLLKAIIDVMNDLNPDGCFSAAEVVAELRQRRYWKPGAAKTPEKTVHMYFTENPHIFKRTQGIDNAEYFLDRAYWRK